MQQFLGRSMKDKNLLKQFRVHILNIGRMMRFYKI